MKKWLVPLVLAMVTMSLIVSPVLAKGGCAKGTTIWFYQDGNSTVVYKGVYFNTASGIVHQWRYSPNDLHLVFKPASAFPEPDPGDGYFYWKFVASRYTEVDTFPGSLSDFYTDGAYYWVKITVQD